MAFYLRYVLELLIALAIALLANDFVWFKLLATSTGSSAAKIYRIYGAHPQNEIPIFGSSRAQAHFVPELIVSTAFNYGVDAMSLGETLDLVETYLKNADKDQPSVIIVNVDPWGFPQEGKFSTVGDYSLVDGSPWGIRAFGKVRSAFANWLNERTGGTKKISKGAALQLSSRTPQQWQAINATLKPMFFSDSKYWRQRISGLVSNFNVKFVWVVGPCAPQWKRHFASEAELASFCDWLKGLPNSRVVNFYSDAYDESLFVDPTHLNIKGAQLFSTRLQERLHDIAP